METFLARFAEALQEAGITDLRALARDHGFSDDLFETWFDGHVPKRATLQGPRFRELCDFLGTTVEYLSDGQVLGEDGEHD